MTGRHAVAAALLAVAVGGCTTGNGTSQQGAPALARVTTTSAAPTQEPTASPSPVDPAQRRERLLRQMRGTGSVLELVRTDTRRAGSTIDGMTLAEALTHTKLDFEPAPDDDVYTARVTTNDMGIQLPDGTIDPMYEDVDMWVVRQHHFLEPVGCGKIRSSGSPPCRPCAAFYDYVYLFAPSGTKEPGRFSLNLRTELTTGTEAAEAEAAGLELCSF